ncbi:MAG: V-type ATP synthase subunit A, partial [Clostridia bacterium]|nr:V-type ATP synthase subunit A [Clostridia bacterium]
MSSNNIIYGINGPVVTIRKTKDFSMQEMVYVGENRLVGEVIGINDRLTTIQCYEITTGLKPGEPVFPTGSPMSVTLGPGVLANIFDGIERPLREIEKQCGPFIEKGINVPPLNEEKQWDV